MPIRSRNGGSRGVSVDIETPWAAQGPTSTVTNLTTMARFQQRQLMEKEQKLLQLYDQQQQRAHQVAQRGSAGSNTSNGSGSGTTTQSVTRTTTTSHSTSNSQGGKVRQMFDERRQTTVKGIDRSYPLEPLENKPRKNGAGAPRNNNTISGRHSVTVKRTIRADTNGNVNKEKPVINYHEEVTHETFGPKLVHREEDLEEFDNENDLDKWKNSNQDNNSEANNYEIRGNDRERAVERTKYGGTKKVTAVKKKKSETLIPSGAGPRKQESRTYRNMIKIELGRKSPEWRTASRESLRGISKSPERNVEKFGVKSVSKSPVQMQNSILPGNCKIDENKKYISAYSEHKSSNTSAEGIFNKSESRRASKNFPRESSPSSREKSKITEGKKDFSLPQNVRNKSPECVSELSNNIEEAGGISSPRIQSPIYRQKSKPDDVKCDKVSPSSSQFFLEKLDTTSGLNGPKNIISLKRLDKPSTPKSDNYYPRRKSDFEKSRIFRKLQEELDRDSPEDLYKSSSEDYVKTLRKEKSPSLPKYNESFFRIKDYPRRTSDFEKSDTFSKLRNSLDEDEKKMPRGRTRRRSATPPVVKSSYERIKEFRLKRKNSKTTFNKLQEDLDRSSPECKLSSTLSNFYDNFSSGKKSESEKSRIFKKLQMELSISPEPTIDPDNETYKHHSPTRISLKNYELEISNNFTKARATFENFKSVELVKDHLLLSEKKNESNVKYTLDDIDRDLSPRNSHEKTPHKVVKKDKPKDKIEKSERTENVTKTLKNVRALSSGNEAKISPKESFSTFLIDECSPIRRENSPGKNEKCKSTYKRTDSVESALRKFNSIDNVTIENSSKKVRKTSSDSRRSSLHAATASWTMKTRSTNQHIHKNVSTPSKTTKVQHKIKSKKLKASKRVKALKEIPRSPSPSPSCKKRLFTDSESDAASEDTKASGKTITIETFTETTMTSPSSSMAQLQQPLKILRSIEDIRNSMTRDNKFMETIDKSTDNLINPKVTIRIISPNTARRTGYINQYVEFGVSKSGDCSEINVKPARRIEKTPSPDDPRRRITSNETKNVSRNNSDITLRPTSRESGRGKQSENSRSIDVVDYNGQTRRNSDNGSPKKNSAFVIELEEEPRSKSISSVKKALNDRQSPEKITSQSRQKVSSVRTASAVSTNSSCSSNQGGSSTASKSRMATKTRGVTSGNRTPSAKANIPASNTDSGLPGCKICGRRFASDRLSLHEQICVKTTQKKRKTFDPVVQRIKGTELEPFVKKISKKGSDKKTKKPEVKSNWRRKHEDFINAIRSAKQMQAHLAAGGKLSDLPPPPASDTSDYIQCPHCGRKFNQGAAERHIPKCEHMVHNKPNPRAQPKPKR